MITVALDSYPRCKRRLDLNFTRYDDPAMSNYWAAVIVADFCQDEALTEFGGFNFDDKSAANGARLLYRLEQLLKAGKRKVIKFVPDQALVSLLGSRGVKTSELKTADDFWRVGQTLFPGFVSRTKSIHDLAYQIRKIPKKKRKALADANFRRLPENWVSGSDAHRSKLQ